MRVSICLRAVEVAQLHENLTQRGQRDGETVTGSERLVEGHASFGERQRPVEMLAHERDVCLVVRDAGEQIVGGNRLCQTLALAESGLGLFASARLREEDGRQRVDERQMPAFPGGMKRGRGLRQVLADDAGVADVLVAVGELIVRETDRPRVMGEIRVLERTRVQRDGS